jgi:four helix bundle protein
MSEVLSYRELDVWKHSRILVKSIYQITRDFPKEEQFGLTNQLRRAVVSIPSNIAEGCGRNHAKDSIQFFFIARGSLYEVETQVIVSFDLDYLSQTDLDSILAQIIKCKKILNGFINYYQSKTNIQQPTTGNEILEQYGNSNTI